MSQVKILGIKINNLSPQEILERIDSFLQSKNKHYVVTPNPEFLVAATKDKKFREILNYADLSIADGVGLTLAAKFLGQRLLRFTGADLVGYLCELAEQKNYPVFLLGGGPDIARQTAENLRLNFPQLKITGTESGGQVDSAGRQNNTADIINKINQARPKILFVAFGQVKQEKWIFNNLDQLNSVKVAIGVGGAFDFIAGRLKRAPKLLQRIGLEWLYRLIQEPARYKRIFNAIIVFGWLILKDKFLTKKNDEQINN